MQATIASGGRTKAPHELAMNRTVMNNTLGTTGVPRTGVGYSSVESSFTGRRVRSRDNQIPLADCSAYGLTPSGTLSREANLQLYADLSYAAYTYGQTSSSRALNWQMNQLAYSDGGSGAGYSYDRDPRPENWSRNEQTYAEYVHPTYGYEQASNYIFPQDLSQLAGQETLQPRNHSSSTYDGPALESEETLIHHFGNGYQHLFAFRESSVTEPSLYMSHDSAYYTEEDTKIERSLSPPSSQLFLPESSDFFLDYTDVGLETDASSMNCPHKTEEVVPENIGQVGLGIDYFTAEEVSTELLPVVPPPNSTRESKRLLDYFTAEEVSTELLPVVPPPKSTRESKRLLDYLTAEEVSTELLPVVPPSKSTQRENKRLKIDTDLFTSLPQTNTSSPTEPTSATSATSATSTSSVNRNGKKFPCAYCTKVFNRPSSRSTHELVHTGEKPHMCTFPTCGKQFSVLSNLRRHLKIHRAPPKGRGHHANSSKKSNNSHDINNNISSSNIINQTSGDNINSINSIGNYIHGLGATSPHPYGGMGVREYFY